MTLDTEHSRACAGPPPALVGSSALAHLSPAYFGLVMATGIVALGADMHGWPMLAVALFYLNLAQYLVLCVLFAWRALRYRRDFIADVFDHLRGLGYFTVVAGTGILAAQFIQQQGWLWGGTALGLLTGLLWFGLTYTIFTALTIKADKPGIDKGIAGSWLLAVVATQSLVVLGGLLAARATDAWQPWTGLAVLSMWLWGGMLYVWITALIFYRYMFYRLLPEDLLPPCWINMGAMAISTLAGALLVQAAGHDQFLAALMPFLKGFTVFYWAVGTWWIPLLVALGVWRYVQQRYPFEYDPLYWGAVFPLGMYAVCTWQMDSAMGFGFLGGLGSVFFHAAVLAWGLTYAGLLHRIWRLCRRAPARQTA